MLPVSSPSAETQPSATGRLRLLRVGVVAALLCLGVYALSVAWNQFRPKPLVAVKAHPVQRTGVQSTATPAVPARSAKAAETGEKPATDTTAAMAVTASGAVPVTEPAAPVAAPDATSPDAIDPSATGEPTAPEPAPIVEPAASPATDENAEALAAAIAEFWEQARQAAETGLTWTAQSVEQFNAAAARHQDSLEQRQPGIATAPPAPPAVVDAGVPEFKTARSTNVMLVNPRASGGVIHYLVDGETYSLYPGQTHELDGEKPVHVAFHRGGNFGDFEQALTPGNYVFRVTANGWDLGDGDSEHN